MAMRAIGKYVPPVDPSVTIADNTPGNENHYRGAPCFPPNRPMPYGCTIKGTRPGDPSRWVEDIAATT